MSQHKGKQVLVGCEDVQFKIQDIQNSLYVQIRVKFISFLLLDIARNSIQL